MFGKRQRQAEVQPKAPQPVVQAVRPATRPAARPQGGEIVTPQRAQEFDLLRKRGREVHIEPLDEQSIDDAIDALFGQGGHWHEEPPAWQHPERSLVYSLLKLFTPPDVQAEWAERFRRGVVETTAERTGAARDFDVRADRWIATETAAQFAELLKAAKTILWNGPVGVFEVDAFGEGTKALSLAIAESDAFSIAGGGDTLAAIDKYGVADRVSYISTGGGAFLEFVEGKVLPAVAALEAAASKQ